MCLMESNTSALAASGVIKVLPAILAIFSYETTLPVATLLRIQAKWIVG